MSMVLVVERLWLCMLYWCRPFFGLWLPTEAPGVLRKALSALRHPRVQRNELAGQMEEKKPALS